MLISNFPDAQTKAVEFGALPGFGKTSIGAPETVARLSACLTESATQPGE